MNLYTVKADTYFSSRREEMIPHVPSSARTVLEIGCGGAGFAAALKEQREIHVTAVEAFPDAAEAARGRVDELHVASLEEAMPALQGRQFDCVVMNDVIEHLADPWAALRLLHGLLQPGTGRFVASIPNMRYLPVFKDYVQAAQFEYQNDGVMDRTHLRFFTHRSMVNLFEDTGYAVEHQVGINMTELPFKLRCINWLTGGAMSDLRFQQYACVARRV